MPAVSFLGPRGGWIGKGLGVAKHRADGVVPVLELSANLTGA